MSHVPCVQDEKGLDELGTISVCLCVCPWTDRLTGHVDRRRRDTNVTLPITLSSNQEDISPVLV